MSIPGAAYDAPVAHKQYFCHQCSRAVLITASAAAAGELSCPECRADFLEEGPAATILPFDLALMPTASSPPRSSSSSTAAPPSNLSNFITSFLGLQDAPRARSSSGSGAASAARTATPENEPESFDRLAFFQDYIRGLEESGADIQVLLDGAPVNVAPGSFIDNFDPGQDLEQLIEQIRQNRPNSGSQDGGDNEI